MKLVAGGGAGAGGVAPHAGAWIETRAMRSCAVYLAGSPPTRGRGLKLSEGCVMDWLIASPPTRGRGLKHLVNVSYVTGGRRRPPRGGVD